MTINSEQIQALKAAAESCDKQEPLSLVVYHGKMCLRNKGGIVFTVLRDICFPEYSAENENYARLAELCTPDSILSLLAERDADKALIAELKVTEAHSQRGWNEAHDQESRAEARELQISEINDALCKLLPGVQYMDPPDGGSVTPLEQVSRMVADYRQLIAEQAKRIVQLEISCDRNYVEGMKTGWNYCDAGNSDGFNTCVEQREKDIRTAGITLVVGE